MSRLIDQYVNYIQPAYRYRREDWPHAKQIVFEILADLTGRRGLRQSWNEIEEGIQDEILIEWLRITEAVLEQKEAEGQD